MESTPGPRGGMLRKCVLVVFAVMTATVGACRKDAPPPPPAEDQAQRETKAATLYRRAQAAPIPEKYDLFKRLFALYDDTARGRDGYLEVVVAMTHDRPPKTGDALQITRTYAERHPTDERVGEAFCQIVDTAWGTKEDQLRTEALAAWEAHLAERDVGNDLPKRVVFADFVRLRLRQERWEDAEVAIETALAEPEITGAARVELLVRKGSLLAEKLGRKEDGLAAFRRALDLANELRGRNEPKPGTPPAQIEAEIEKLEAR